MTGRPGSHGTLRSLVSKGMDPPPSVGLLVESPVLKFRGFFYYLWYEI